MTNFFNDFRDHLHQAIAGLQQAGTLPAELPVHAVTVEPPRDPSHGDMASNAAMVLAKPAKQKPRDVAALLVPALEALPGVASVEIAGPGFLNLRLEDTFWRARVADMLRAGPDYGRSTLGAGRRVNVEYVSANPTGPMHVGHGRGAVFGDALARLLAFAGYDVTREYYVNDAGAQVDVLARSLHLRYREALGETIDAIPEGLYPGDYLVPVGQALARRDGDRWRDVPEQEWLPVLRDYAIDAMMALIRDDLAALGVEHAVFTSERALVAAGAVQAAVDDLQARDLVYTGVLEPPKGKKPEDWEPRPQLLFRASDFGDDTDRPLAKADGTWTYFATDMAYHADKVKRGFHDLIDVWGADHGGYVKRVQAAVKALAGDPVSLDVKLCQMVNLLSDGQPVKMSKRAGTFVTLREVVDEVTAGVVRFMMLTRRNDAHLDFDLVKVREQSRDNPVFYVQYAHARACSVLRHAAEMFPNLSLDAADLAKVDLSPLTDAAEIALMTQLAGWPRTVEGAAEAHEPHRVAFYLNDVAAAFHGLWNKGRDDATLRFLHPDDIALSHARLALVKAVAVVVASGLAVMGVTALEEME